MRYDFGKWLEEKLERAEEDRPGFDGPRLDEASYNDGFADGFADALFEVLHKFREN